MGSIRPSQRHTPSRIRSEPVSHPPSTSSRKNRAFPRVARHNRSIVRLSTTPPSTPVTNRFIAARGSCASSNRSANPFFHNVTTGSGAGSPVRTVSTTHAVRVRAS